MQPHVPPQISLQRQIHQISTGPAQITAASQGYPPGANPPQMYLQQIPQGRQQSQNLQTIQHGQYPLFFTTPQRQHFQQIFNTPQNQQHQQQQHPRQFFIAPNRESGYLIINECFQESMERPECLELSQLKNQEDFQAYLDSFADKDNYFCQICHNLLWQPVSCTNCSKLYCKDCLNHWLESCSSCPTCRDRFEYKRVDKSIMNNLSKLVFVCSQSDTGCSEQIQYESLLKHQHSCPFKVISCKNAGCEFKSIRSEMNTHESECPHGQLSCQWCQRQIKRMNAVQHEEICEMKVLGCENQGCSESLTRAEMNKHIVICPYNVVRCEMCNTDMKLKDIQAHTAECDFLVLACRGCKQTMFKKQLQQHEETCELVELQCPECTQVFTRKDESQHSQINCLKYGQRILFESKTQLLCENACLKKDIETLKLCFAQLYEQMQDLSVDRRNSTQKINRPPLDKPSFEK